MGWGPSHLVASSPCSLAGWGPSHLIASSTFIVNVHHFGAEVQADSFSFECRGCMRMKELEVELEQLRLLILAVVGR